VDYAAVALSPDGRDFVDFVTGDEAGTVLVAHGFDVGDPDGDAQ